MHPEPGPVLSPTPRLAVAADLVGVWRAACADHAVAWRAWCAGRGGCAAVVVALDREESAARALASFHRAER